MIKFRVATTAEELIDNWKWFEGIGDDPTPEVALSKALVGEYIVVLYIVQEEVVGLSILRIQDKGCHVVWTNSDTNITRVFYKEYWSFIKSLGFESATCYSEHKDRVFERLTGMTKQTSLYRKTL